MNRTVCAIVVSLVLIASSAVVCAQETLDLPLVLVPGDRLFIEYVHERNKNGQSSTANIVAQIVIEDVRNESFVANWTTHSVEADGLILDARSPGASDYLLGVPIKYVADLDGTPIRIDNKSKMLDTILGGPHFESQPQETIAAVRSFMDAMSDEALAQLLGGSDKIQY